MVDNLVDAIQVPELTIEPAKDSPVQGPHYKTLMAFLHPYIATPHERIVWGQFHKLQGLQPEARDTIERTADSEGLSSDEFQARLILEQLCHFLVAKQIPFLAPTSSSQVDGPIAADYQYEGEWLTSVYCKERFGLDDSSLSKWARLGCLHLDNNKLRREKFPPQEKRWCFHRLDIDTITAKRESDEA